jgi:MFS family permease
MSRTRDAARGQTTSGGSGLDEQFGGSLRRFIMAAYGPPLLSSIGYGAVTPLVALSALNLGASVPLSALISGLTGVATMLGDLPASWIATRLGEKRAIIAACCWDACWLTVAFLAHDLGILSLAVFCFGVSGSVFGLARQTFVTESTPAAMRARALSSLGGTQRIGYFLGPLAGSAIVATKGLSVAYGFAAIMSVFAAVVTFALPDLPADVAARRRSGTGPTLSSILRGNARIYLVLGSGILTLSLVRAVRQTILPLWCESLGMSDATASLVFSISMGVDMSLFFLGGFVMDRFGREWVALPSLIILGLGLASLALTHHLGWVILVAVVLGLGNGVGSGIVMTLGGDASPVLGRTQFLSGWRLMGDAGTTLGPVAISGLTALGGLATATVVLGGFAVVCAAWLRHGITWMYARKTSACSPAKLD